MNNIKMILLISILILLHEAGHYLAARICNIKVTRFGIGLPLGGPSWKLFKLGDTVFYIHAVLFGGYVSFAEPESNKPVEKKEDKNSEKTQELYSNQVSLIQTDSSEKDDDDYLPDDSPELYDNKSISQKLFVISAGVLMNVIFAVMLVLFCACYYHKLPTQNQNIIVDNFSSKITSNIQEKGILKDDQIVKVNSIPVNSLYQLTFLTSNSKLFDNYAQEDLIEKNKQELLKLNPNINNEIPENTIINLPQPMAETPLKANKNMLRGLEKYKKDGIELTKNQIELRNKIYNKKSYTTTADTTLDDIAAALSDTYKPLSLTVIRNNNEVVIDDIILNTQGVMGIMLKVEDIYIDTNTPSQIVKKSIQYIYSTTTTMLYSLWQLITGKVSVLDMHGVIAIVKVGGDVISSKGMFGGILLTAMISINLAIMNFIPIPALDGGHAMFLIIEKLTGAKLSRELGEKINTVFIILLVILMAVISINDVYSLITKKL